MEKIYEVRWKHVDDTVWTTVIKTDDKKLAYEKAIKALPTRTEGIVIENGKEVYRGLRV